MEDEGIGFDEAAPRRRPRSRLHHAHAGARRPRPLPRDLVEEHLGPLREALGISQDGLMGLGRVNPQQRQTSRSA